LTVIDENPVTGATVFHFTVQTPMMVKNRDRLLVARTMKDFPQKGSLALHSKSTAHKDWPERENKAIRIDCKITAFVVRDSENGKGCFIEMVS